MARSDAATTNAAPTCVAVWNGCTSAPRFPRDCLGCDRGTRGVDGRQAHVAENRVVVARRRLIPDVDSAARGNSRHAVRLLDRRVANRDVLSDPVVRGGRKHHDAIRISDRRVALDQIVVGGPDEADTKIDKGTRGVTISARLVPPERVIVPLDSYAAACGGRRTVPH